MKLHNVTVTVVDLVWADNASDAVQQLRERASLAGLTPLGDHGDNAFVSEPCAAHDWGGDTDMAG